MDAQYIPMGKPVELCVQKLAAKRLPRKRYCTAGDLSTNKNIGGTIRIANLSGKKNDRFLFLDQMKIHLVPAVKKKL